MMLPHDSAHTHVTGQSEYVDDRPLVQGELHLELVLSTEAHAKIKEINTSKALRSKGVVAIYTAKDFHHNFWGTIFKDQQLLAKDFVHFFGEPIAIVVGESKEAAQQGRALVQVQYEALPAILSVSQAKEKRSFIGEKRKIERGAVEDAFKNAPHKLSGKVVIRGADHFYLENQASIAYPLEDGQIEVHSSSQHPTETQHVVAHALGIPDKDVVCIVKRMGGAFGGKESQAAPFAAYAALVAHKLKKPARMVVNKDDDMIITGKRNPFENDYRVAFDKDGNILALDVELYSDGGAYADLSTSIMERAMLHIDNAYYIPNLRVTGQVCKTNFHPHTAFRGFGGPKGVATIERIIEEIAHALKKDPLEIRKRNVYRNEDGKNVTHYGQTIVDNNLPALFEQLEKSSKYQARRREIVAHNKSGKNTLRGLSLTPVKFGISFTTRFLNQANAYVIVHRDGTLQVSTGATEMGQGVNARIADAVALELGLERSAIRMMPTRTDKNGNTSPTAASSGVDLNAAAATQAARKIKARLSHLAVKLFQTPEKLWARHTAGLGTQDEISVPELSIKQNDPNFGADWSSGVATFEGVIFEKGNIYLASNPSKKIHFYELVNEAYLNRISLSDYAFYKFNGLSFDKLKGQGNAFLYFTQGVAATEVSVDKDTGELKILRSDILMDLGRPINHALDEGQIMGGFIQGMGWVTSERLFYSAKGALLTHAPSTYKIPSVHDIPRDFRVEFFKNEKNYGNFRGTKAVGEPPLLLSLSVWTAIQNALSYLPKYEKEFPSMSIPASQEERLRKIYEF